jgi:hypothetical protein
LGLNHNGQVKEKPAVPIQVLFSDLMRTVMAMVVGNRWSYNYLITESVR